MTTVKTTHISFLIFEGFPMACLTSMIEPLRVANEVSESDTFSWRLVSENGRPVTASANITFDVADSLSTIDTMHYLVLLAPPKAEFQNEQSVGILRRLSRHGCVFCAVSGGVFPLARAKLASTVPLSVHWCYRAAFEKEFPSYLASDQIIEISNSFVTASGAAGGFEVALNLIEERLGSHVSTEVACWFQHPMMRKSGIQQITPVPDESFTKDSLPAAVNDAIALMQSHINDPLSVEDIAAMISVTSRHLERLFKSATGHSPFAFYRSMRMRAARQLVLYTNEKISVIAAELGYSEMRVFRRHYIASFKLSPENDRRQINLYRVEGNISLPSLWAGDAG
jgi:transcriptional regulator GlxA family with amidase domain